MYVILYVYTYTYVGIDDHLSAHLASIHTEYSISSAIMEYCIYAD